MGLFGKSKKEIEREEKEKQFQEKYGISKQDAYSNHLRMCDSLGTSNLDIIMKLRSPQFYEKFEDMHTEIVNLNNKYDRLLNAINKQNELLSQLLSK